MRTQRTQCWRCTFTHNHLSLICSTNDFKSLYAENDVSHMYTDSLQVSNHLGIQVFMVCGILSSKNNSSLWAYTNIHAIPQRPTQPHPNWSATNIPTIVDAALRPILWYTTLGSHRLYNPTDKIRMTSKEAMITPYPTLTHLFSYTRQVSTKPNGILRTCNHIRACTVPHSAVCSVFVSGCGYN